MLDAAAVFSYAKELRLDSSRALETSLRRAQDRGLDAFVDDVRDGCARNVILAPLLESERPAFAAGSSSSGGGSSSPPLDELSRAAQYCVFLDALSQAMADDPAAADDIFASLRSTLHGTPQWWSWCSPFEILKVSTVEMALELFQRHRSSGWIYPSFGRLGLPANILEAVAQDVNLGNAANALAGLALALAPPGARPAQVSQDERRVVEMHMPLARSWQSLYVSWNLAFVSRSYADAPYFCAALLAPSVLNAPPPEFMLRRTYALYAHIVLQIKRRGALGRRERVMATHDIRDATLLKRWSEKNHAAAVDYTRRRLQASYLPFARQARHLLRSIYA